MLPRNIHRERFVQETFDHIADRYDFLNRVISFHLDTVWRRRLINALELKGSSQFVLDLGSGTGDLTLAAVQEMSQGGRVFGLDFSYEMLRQAEIKKRKLVHGERASYILGSALSAPFGECSFDSVMTAFVLRNISDLSLFFTESYRLLRPGGLLATLDMFPPNKGCFSYLYSFYFYHLVPWIGAGLARNKTAYRYLSDSVREFNPPERVAETIRAVGFEEIKIEKFLRGAVCLHIARKPQGT